MNTLSPLFCLDNFEGPLDLLIHLIQSQELDITQLPVTDLVKQYRDLLRNQDDDQIGVNSELLATTAFLLWLKSKRLLPQLPQQNNDIEIDGPRWDIIHYLIEYQAFKEVSNFLLQQENLQLQTYARTPPLPADEEKPSPLEPMQIELLGAAFQKLLQRTKPLPRKTIAEELYRVRDQINLLRKQITTRENIAFEELFAPQRCREEWVVTFLAILELMKIGEICVFKTEDRFQLQKKNNEKEEMKP